MRYVRVTRRNKLIILIAYLFVLAVTLPLYRMKRLAADKRLRARIAAVENEKAKAVSAASEMDRLQHLFPAEPGITTFIEDLYAAAQLSKLSSHAVSTASGSAARTTSRNPSAQSNPLNSHRFTIAVDGSFRNVAEYIRRVQNFPRFKRISEIRLVPGKQGISGSISLELFSLKDHHAK